MIACFFDSFRAELSNGDAHAPAHADFSHPDGLHTSWLTYLKRWPCKFYLNVLRCSGLNIWLRERQKKKLVHATCARAWLSES